MVIKDGITDGDSKVEAKDGAIMEETLDSLQVTRKLLRRHVWRQYRTFWRKCWYILRYLGGNHQIAKGFSGSQSGGSSGGRYVVSKSTTTKTSTSNGVKKTIKIVKTKYSDGTEEQEEEETITQ